MTKKYVFHLDKLTDGDILFSVGGDKWAQGIATATFGKYSHTMIYLEQTLIHAMPDGVYSKNPQRMLFDSPEKFCVMRLANTPSKAVIQIIVNHARGLIGALYSKPEAGRTLLYKNTNTAQKSERQYCSRLVAQCFQKADILLVQNSDYCSPNDIARSSLLKQVDGGYREASPNDIAFAEQHDPNIDIQKATFDWLHKVRELVESKGLGTIGAHRHVGLFLEKYPEYDDVVCQFIQSTQYLTMYNVDRAINPYRYDEFAFLQKFIGNYHLPDVLAVEYKISRENLTLRRKVAVAGAITCSIKSSKYYELEKKLADNLLREAECRVEVLNKIAREFKIVGL